MKSIETAEIHVDAYKNNEGRIIPPQILTLWDCTCSNGEKTYHLQPPIISYLQKNAIKFEDNIDEIY